MADTAGHDGKLTIDGVELASAISVDLRVPLDDITWRKFSSNWVQRYPGKQDATFDIEAMMTDSEKTLFALLGVATHTFYAYPDRDEATDYFWFTGYAGDFGARWSAEGTDGARLTMQVRQSGSGVTAAGFT